jgi:hypothetical protein
MNKRFIKVYESIVNRYTRGGFLTSDLVKFVPDVLKDPFFKGVDSEYKAKVKAYAESGENLRVRNIKSTFPAVMGAGNPDYNGYSFGIEVAREIAPGKFDNESIVVPQHLLVRVETYPNLPTVPDKFKRKDDTQIEPIEVKDENEEVPFLSPGRTLTSDRGNKKDTRSDVSLLNKNVKIPSSPAKGASDPASYTANYLP